MSHLILKTDKALVVPFENKHLTSRYVSWLNDPEVVKYSEQRHVHHTLSSCKSYFKAAQHAGNLFLAIEALGEWGHVGNMNVRFDAANGIADVSILIGEKHTWGKGIASSAWIAVLNYLLKYQNIRKITAGTMAINEPMLRLMERSGMHIESIRKKHFLWQEQEVDLVHAAKFQEDMHLELAENDVKVS